MHYEVQRANVRTACQQIAKVLPGNELIITHGNGPQVGLIALQQNTYPDVPLYPLDAIGAESIGMIGYMIARELTNVVPRSITVTNVLTQTEIDPNDPRMILLLNTRLNPSVLFTPKKKLKGLAKQTAGQWRQTTTNSAELSLVLILKGYWDCQRLRL